MNPLLLAQVPLKIPTVLLNNKMQFAQRKERTFEIWLCWKICRMRMAIFARTWTLTASGATRVNSHGSWGFGGGEEVGAIFWWKAIADSGPKWFSSELIPVFGMEWFRSLISEMASFSFNSWWYLLSYRGTEELMMQFCHQSITARKSVTEKISVLRPAYRYCRLLNIVCMMVWRLRAFRGNCILKSPAKNDWSSRPAKTQKRQCAGVEE
jgi:hypothetical protein